jgi:16S rRNA (adenine1518-N6/adenine1519-N6)-dimethyltransferase
MGRPKRRRLGQNFLVDRNVAQKIVALLDDEPARVLEIGPGRGALTELLGARFGRVLAAELDAGLAHELRARFRESSVSVVHADALHDPLEPLLAGEGPWQVASNLPYSVGTAILRRLLPRHDLFTGLVVMLQREVAERVVAQPGDRHHGLLALERAAWADAGIAFQVGPSAFRPRPKVVSSVIMLQLHAPTTDTVALEGGLRLASHALNHSRKMLANALRPLCDADRIIAAGLDPQARPATVDLAGWIRLAAITDRRSKIED